jgi:GxxExxY protein
MGKQDHPHQELTRAIIGAAFEVSNALGCGFLEKVYENALAAELKRQGLKLAQQVPIRVIYKETTVGEYVADMIVEAAVLVEAKATPEHHPIYAAQTLNYLKATQLPVGLLLNFGQPRLDVRRYVLSDRLRREADETERMME